MKKDMHKLPKGKLSTIIDGQLGSTGKGLLISYLAEKGAFDGLDVVVSLLSPNAGHTFIKDGTVHVANQIPIIAHYNKKCKIYISHGACVHVDSLVREAERFNIDLSRITIHPHTPIISDKDLAYEHNLLKHGSTFSGTGSARGRRIVRDPTAVAEGWYSARGSDSIIRPYSSGKTKVINLASMDLHKLLNEGGTAFAETSQGYCLNLADGYYPYCTSKNITPATVLADTSLPIKMLGSVYATYRTTPIRIHGNSGPFAVDSIELGWGGLAGIEPEMTSVTMKPRRIATFSYRDYVKSINEIDPDFVFMNFMNYNDRIVKKTLRDMHEELLSKAKAYRPFDLLGYGRESSQCFLVSNKD